jgi:hypothetical protein
VEKDPTGIRLDVSVLSRKSTDREFKYFGGRKMKNLMKSSVAGLLGGLVLALFSSNVGNAAVVPFPTDTFNLNVAGDAVTFVRNVTSKIGYDDGLAFDRQYTMNLTHGFLIRITIADTTLSPDLTHGIDPLKVVLHVGATTFESTSFLQMALLTDDSPFFIDVIGTRKSAGGRFTLNVEAISEVPIPAAALLFASGLGVLGFAGRRKTRATNQAAS